MNSCRQSCNLCSSAHTQFVLNKPLRNKFLLDASVLERHLVVFNFVFLRLTYAWSSYNFRITFKQQHLMTHGFVLQHASTTFPHYQNESHGLATSVWEPKVCKALSLYLCMRATNWVYRHPIVPHRKQNNCPILPQLEQLVLLCKTSTWFVIGNAMPVLDEYICPKPNLSYITNPFCWSDCMWMLIQN